MQSGSPGYVWTSSSAPPMAERQDAGQTAARVIATAPFLRDIHVQNPAGFVSFGLPIGDIPSMKRDIPTVVARISNDLFLGDLQAHEKRMTGDVAADFSPEMYARAVRNP